MEIYLRKIDVRWSDIDQNRHVRHSAYYDYGAHTRIKFIEESGFALDLLKAHIGPVIFKEECSFIKELLPGETISCNLLKGELAQDGSRWVLHHEIYNQKGEKAAHLTVKGAWMDLNQRKLTVPPKALADYFASLSPGEDYVYKKNS